MVVLPVGLAFRDDIVGVLGNQVLVYPGVLFLDFLGVQTFEHPVMPFPQGAIGMNGVSGVLGDNDTDVTRRVGKKIRNT